MYMDALFGQEVKSTRGESGRCLGEIDVLAGSQDNQGLKRQKGASHRAWADRPDWQRRYAVRGGDEAGVEPLFLS